jgi:hypothetical protein
MTQEAIDTSADQENEAPVQEVAPSETNLTIQDLTTCMQIIQVCGNRGAIKAEEMTIVGNLYNKLHMFLDASGAIPKAEAPVDEDQVDSDPDSTSQSQEAE